MFEILEPETPELKFPVARKSKNNGKIVLFWSLTKGVVISSENCNEVGYVFSTRLSCADTDFWRPVDLKITG